MQNDNTEADPQLTPVLKDMPEEENLPRKARIWCLFQLINLAYIATVGGLITLSGTLGYPWTGQVIIGLVVAAGLGFTIFLFYYAHFGKGKQVLREKREQESREEAAYAAAKALRAPDVSTLDIQVKFKWESLIYLWLFSLV